MNEWRLFGLTVAWSLNRTRFNALITRGLVLAAVCVGTLVAILQTGCGGLPDRENQDYRGSVVVRVKDAETTLPLKVPATIIAGGVRGVLEPDEEQLVLRDVPLGTGTPPTQPLTASAEGYVTRTQQVQMSAIDATWVEVALQSADLATTGTVEGTVTDVEDGEPIRNAFVRFSRPDADPDLDDDDDLTDAVGGYTDSEGRFIIGGIPRGERLLTAQASGFLPFSDLITINADANAGNPDLEIELVAGDATVDVPGVVVDILTRQPVEGAQVTVGDSDPVISRSNGRFTVRDVTVGEQTVEVTAQGYERFSGSFTIMPGMDRITIELLEEAEDPPSGPFTIAGTVTLTGAPDNSGAVVTAVLIETGEQLGQFTTGSDGRYTLFVPPGEYEVTVRFEGRSLSRDVTVPPGGVAVDGVDFALTVQ